MPLIADCRIQKLPHTNRAQSLLSQTNIIHAMLPLHNEGILFNHCAPSDRGYGAQTGVNSGQKGDLEAGASLQTRPCKGLIGSAVSAKISRPQSIFVPPARAAHQG